MTGPINRLSRRITQPVSLTLVFIGIILLICAYNFRWKDEQWKYAVHTDAANYYRYLPMVFIEHEFDDPEENPSVIKYFVGTAVMYSPFFGAACLGSSMIDQPVDGYSLLFPILISFGTIFYMLLGLYFFAGFLRFFIDRTWIICVTLVALTFGTVAYFYTVNAPGWAHIPAFFLVSLILFHLKKLMLNVNGTSIVIAISATAFLFFIRPTDVIILVLAPFLAGNLAAFIVSLKQVLRQRKAVLIALAFAMIPLICQLGIYKMYSDEFFIWSYTKEGFDFLHPEITNVLFSYTKGFFVYTPVCFLSLFGLFRLYRLNEYLFTGVLIYLVLNIYIISSWWCWNYGYSYGPRAFVEHYPIFFFLLALLLDTRIKWLKISVILLMCFFTFLNLFQIYQAIKGILDPDFKTDKKGYWDVFLSTEKGYSGKFYRFPVDENPQNIKSRMVLFNNMEIRDTVWLNPGSQVTDKAHSGKYSSRVNKNNLYSTGIRKFLHDIPYNKDVLIRASGWFYVPEKGSGSYFAISFVKDGKSLNFNPFKLDGYTQHFGQWEYHVFEMYMPKFSGRIENDPASLVEFYYFNNSDINCYLDDLKIEFIEFRHLDRVLDLSWE
jgi:hypothetical protein